MPGIGTAVGSSRVLDELEKTAIVDAGNAGGSLLDEYMESDLAKLTAEQFAEFIKTVVLAFGDSVRRQVIEGKPPF